MLTGDIRNQIDRIWDAFWSGGISNPLESSSRSPISSSSAQRMMLFRPRTQSAVSEYTWAFLCTGAAYRQAASLVGGSASPRVNIGDIISFGIPHPPISLQSEFARRVAAVQKLKTAHRAHLAELDALFACLQHRAFRGEL